MYALSFKFTLSRLTLLTLYYMQQTLGVPMLLIILLILLEALLEPELLKSVPKQRRGGENQNQQVKDANLYRKIRIII